MTERGGKVTLGSKNVFSLGDGRYGVELMVKPQQKTQISFDETSPRDAEQLM